MTRVVLDSGEENDTVPLKKPRAKKPPKPPKPKLGKPLWYVLPGVAPALSLRQPWAWAVIHAGKVLENRTAWRGCAYRGPILVHAAAGMTKTEYADAVEFMIERKLARRGPSEMPESGLPIIPSREELRRGGVVGVARLVGVVEREHAIRGERTPAIDALTPKERDWWMGKFGLLLAGATQVDPMVPCAGALGLFTPPVSVYNDVLRALSKIEVPVAMHLCGERLLKPSAVNVQANGLSDMFYVCETKTCLCASSEVLAGEECSCLPDRRGQLRACCRTCGSRMRAVDLNSGWPIEG